MTNTVIPAHNNVLCSKSIVNGAAGSFKGRVLGAAPITVPPQWSESVRSGFSLTNTDLFAVTLIAHQVWLVWIVERVLKDWDTGDPEILRAKVTAFGGQR